MDVLQNQFLICLGLHSQIEYRHVGYGSLFAGDKLGALSVGLRTQDELDRRSRSENASDFRSLMAPDVRGRNFVGASFEGEIFDGSDLRDANFMGADLRNALPSVHG
jgi:uncharacterized protein YjbI with pentapeptide repeats